MSDAAAQHSVAPSMGADQSSSPCNAHNRATLVAYGGLAMPLILAESPIPIYLPAFYAQELGLAVGLVGVVFLVARVWDGLSDVLIGWLSDRTAIRVGRRKIWIIFGAPILAATTWLLCNPADEATIWYLWFSIVLFYLADTAVRIPYRSWGADLADDYVERSRVTAFREFFTMFGQFAFAAAPIFLLPEDAPLGDVLSLVSIAAIIALAIGTALIVFGVPDVAAAPPASDSLVRAITALRSDRILRLFALAWLIYMIAQGIVNSLAVFSFKAGLGLPNKIFWSIFILYISMMCSVPITMRLAKAFDKHKLLILGMVINGACLGALIFVPMENFTIVAIIWVVTGFGYNICIYLPWSMMADVIDNGELDTGQRRPGAYMAVLNLTSKIALALGIGIAFGSLELVDFDPTATIYELRDVVNIRLLGFGLPCVLMLAAAFVVLKYPITRERQRTVRELIR